LALGFPVPERVEINETFATRDLVRGLARNPRYRLLALGEKPTRLFEGAGTVLTEHEGHGFPWFVEGARGEPLASGGFAVHSSRSEAQHLEFFRQVDQGLDAVQVQDPLPLVVTGTERDLAYFDDVTSHRASIIGRLTGNHEDTNPHELARLAAPLLEDALASRRAGVVDELVELAFDRGGDVVIVEPGALGAHGPVAALLRY
jgi:hypothetical protein